MIDLIILSLGLLDQSINKLHTSEALPGNVAFKLYDTYGFPIDLTADILRGKNIKLDYKGFESSMNEQKNKALFFCSFILLSNPL